MNQHLKLEATKWPKLLSELVHSNQFLKVFSAGALAAVLLLLLLCFAFLTRPPVFVTLTPEADVLNQSKMPDPVAEVRAAVARYVDRRYGWDPTNVKQRLEDAKAFVAQSQVRVYENAVASVAKFSVEKAVTQRAYPEKLEVNLEKGLVQIRGDRVTSIQGMKAAGDLRLELSFESGPRTKVNPWGIYINKEREEQ
jgi:hypothetical protein